MKQGITTSLLKKSGGREMQITEENAVLPISVKERMAYAIVQFKMAVLGNAYGRGDFSGER